MTTNQRALFKSIEVGQWSFRFLEWMVWKRVNPDREKEWPKQREDKVMYDWCSNQRRFIDTYDDNRVLLLNSEGLFKRDLEMFRKEEAARWDKMFTEYILYRMERGVNSKIVYGVSINDKKFIKLRDWVVNQARYLRKGLLPERRKKLVLGVGLSSIATYGMDFEHWFKILKAYKKKFGIAHVRQGDGEYKALARWVNDVRYKTGKTTEGEKMRLDKIGFIWNMEHYKFDLRLAELVAFHEKEGHWDGELYSVLYNWVNSVRCRIPKEQYRIDRLNEVGFSWHSRKKIRLEEEAAYSIDTV